jgi:hypothetical protein
MKHILLIIMVWVTVTACGQSDITIEQINKEFNKTVADTMKLKRKVVSSIIEPGF